MRLMLLNYTLYPQPNKGQVFWRMDGWTQ